MSASGSVPRRRVNLDGGARPGCDAIRRAEVNLTRPHDVTTVLHGFVRSAALATTEPLP
jgi:hypothetical protein